MESKLDTRHFQPRSMHKYVLLLLAVWGICGAAFFVGYYRVAQSEKFNGIPFKSLTLEGEAEYSDRGS